MAIEIESLAVAWAVEKFHHFLYGYHFILESNQKLLEANPIQKPQSSNSKIAAHFDQNVTIQFFSKIYSGT